MSSSFSENLKNLAPFFNYTPKERTMSTVSLLSTDVMTLKRSLVLLIKNKGLPAATLQVQVGKQNEKGSKGLFKLQCSPLKSYSFYSLNADRHGFFRNIRTQT